MQTQRKILSLLGGVGLLREEQEEVEGVEEVPRPEPQDLQGNRRPLHLQ